MWLIHMLEKRKHCIQSLHCSGAVMFGMSCIAHKIYWGNLFISSAGRPKFSLTSCRLCFLSIRDGRSKTEFFDLSHIFRKLEDRSCRKDLTTTITAQINLGLFLLKRSQYVGIVFTFASASRSILILLPNRFTHQHPHFFRHCLQSVQHSFEMIHGNNTTWWQY